MSGAPLVHPVPTPATATSGEPSASAAVIPIGRTDGEPDRPLRHNLHSLVEIMRLPPPSWRLDGLLPLGGLAVLYGPPGCGKSFLALAWALSLASGKDWLGRRTLYGPALYVAGEGTHGLAARARAFLDAHELVADDPALEFFVVDGVNLLDAGAVADFIADARQVLTSDPAIVVLDTLARVMPGGDENSAQDVGTVIAAADRIRRETGAVVLILHHTQKAGELERGSSALRGAADAMLALANEDHRLTLTVTKQRDSEAGAPLRLRLVPFQGSCIVGPEDGSAAPTGLSRTARTLLETIADLGGATESVSTTAWIRAAKTPERSSYRAIKDELLPRTLVTRDGGRRRYLLTEHGAKITAKGGWQ